VKYVNKKKKELQVDDEWSLTGAAGKKQRKQQRALEQKDEDETKKKLEAKTKIETKPNLQQPILRKGSIERSSSKDLSKNPPQPQSSQPPIWKPPQFSSIIQPPRKVQNSSLPFDYAAIARGPDQNASLYIPKTQDLSENDQKYLPPVKFSPFLQVTTNDQDILRVPSPGNDIPSDLSSEFLKMEIPGDHLNESNEIFQQNEYSHNTLFNPTLWGNLNGFFPASYRPFPNVNQQQPEVYNNWMNAFSSPLPTNEYIQHTQNFFPNQLRTNNNDTAQIQDITHYDKNRTTQRSCWYLF